MLKETETVNKLKNQLSLNSDVAKNPELQQISYDDKILERLSAYKIDIKNFLTITILDDQPPNKAIAQQAASAAEEQPVTPEKDKNLK